MKRISFIALFLLVASGIFAQDEEGIITDETNANKMAVAAGAEWNMNSRNNFAGGAALAFDHNLGASFALGINAAVSYNFAEIVVVEPAAFFRWYFLGSNHTGWFAQTDLGAYLVFEDDELTTLFLGGLRGGIRLPLGNTFFIEPYGRVGYPFMFGVGVLAGVRF
jgi:hemin uptake protein HemP